MLWLMTYRSPSPPPPHRCKHFEVRHRGGPIDVCVECGDSKPLLVWPRVDWVDVAQAAAALVVAVLTVGAFLAGCGASVSEYQRHTSECAERAAVIVEREGTSLEQDMEDLAALRAECEAVE